MEHRPFVTLTTDFGYKDPFAGIMKGVIYSIHPFVDIVDITHGISPQNIPEAAFSLELSYKSFPRGTIHVAVVDPGVGSSRRPIIVSADRYYFIGPDNGIFSRIYFRAGDVEVVHLTADHFFLPARSVTFHGRDIFAPAAAWLSKGIPLSRFGDPISDYVTLPSVTPIAEKRRIEGEVIYHDRYGNAITNIDTDMIMKYCGIYGSPLRISIKGIDAEFKECYSEVKEESLGALVNSFGYLELFVNKGNAVLQFSINPGDKVSCTCS